MTVVFNDFSLNGQFKTNDDFSEYVRSVLLNVLEIMNDRSIPLLSSYSTYSCLVTGKTTLYDLLSGKFNDPVFTVLKKELVQLAFAPYWSEVPCTRDDVKYEYPLCGVDEPNCFTEAISRRNPMFSICPSEFGSEIECKEDDLYVEIVNISDKNKLLEEYLKDSSDMIYVLNNFDFGIEVQTVSIDGKCYAKEALDENNLILDDYLKILEASKWVVDGIKNNRSSHYSKHIEDDIYEMRVGISASREFRLFFVTYNGIKFINGFVKKTQNTPKSEKDKAKNIRDMCLARVKK